MDRRRFLRNGSLFSLAVALGDALELPARANDGNCAMPCNDVVSIVLHGFMFYQFVLDDGPQVLKIIAPQVNTPGDLFRHGYMRGQVGEGRDGCKLQPVSPHTEFPTEGLAPGTRTSFPGEVPSFSLEDNHLGKLTDANAQFAITLPLPCDIVPLNVHGAPTFDGEIGKKINLPKVAGALCLQYKLSSRPPAWIQIGRVNIYAQPLPIYTQPLPCPTDHTGDHFNKALKVSARHFEHQDQFSLTVKCKGSHCDDSDPILPTGVCNLGRYDLYDLCGLHGVPGCQTNRQKPMPSKNDAANEPNTTGGPLCVGFAVKP